jgi:hypothetical protein
MRNIKFIPESISNAVNFICLNLFISILRAILSGDVFFVVNQRLFGHNLHFKLFANGPLANFVVMGQFVVLVVLEVLYRLERVIRNGHLVLFHKFTDEETVIWDLF